MLYAIISVELVSKCLYCKAQSCWYCTNYGSNDKIIKVVATALTYSEILSEYHNLNKDNKNIKYQIHKIEQIETNSTKPESNYFYAILEEAYLLKNQYIKYEEMIEDKKIIEDNEIIYYSSSLQEIQKTCQNILEGKVRTTSHVGCISFEYLHLWNIYKISKKKLPTFLNVI